MIGLPLVYTVVGLTFAGYAVLGLADRANPRRGLNGLFWGLLALSFLAGDRLGDVGNGVLVLALAIIGTIGIGRGRPPTITAEVRAAEASRHRDRLFVPALAVPAVALAGTFLFKHMPGLVDAKQATLVALAAGVALGLTLAFAMLRPVRPELVPGTPGTRQRRFGRLSPAASGPVVPFQEGRRLADSVGWALILPQMLAALGALFAAAGVGDEVGRLLGLALPGGSLLAAVLAYGLGMALLTILMGNAFAAFPVMIAAVGLPLLIHRHGGAPAAVGALGMLLGFSGTLLTPMAANFNIVPAALLDLPDRWGVIRKQAPTALAMLAVNLLLLWGLAFR